MVSLVCPEVWPNDCIRIEQPTRIAIISDLDKFGWAGCEELWAALARKALKDGHEVAFLQSRQTVAPEKIAPLRQMGLELVPQSAGGRLIDQVKNRVSWKVGGFASLFVRSFGQLHRFSPDVIFFTAGGALPPPAFLDDLERSGALKYPYIVVCHNSHIFEKPVTKAEREKAARYYLGARRVLFVAERTRRETEHLLATHLTGTAIIRNPVNMADSSPIPMPSGSTVRIASMGRLTINSKGQDVLLAALGSAEWKGRDWLASIYGSGPHLDLLRALAAHYGIAERVLFKGHVGDVRTVWAENHLLALPSRNESAPLVVVEAMLCGRPCVANDVGGIREWISEPETGFISEGINIESFQSALGRAWSARADWEAMGRRARDKALQMFDPDPGGTLLDILREVVTSAAGG